MHNCDFRTHFKRCINRNKFWKLFKEIILTHFPLNLIKFEQQFPDLTGTLIRNWSKILSTRFYDMLMSDVYECLNGFYGTTKWKLNNLPPLNITVLIYNLQQLFIHDSRRIFFEKIYLNVTEQLPNSYLALTSFSIGRNIIKVFLSPPTLIPKFHQHSRRNSSIDLIWMLNKLQNIFTDLEM